MCDKADRTLDALEVSESSKYFQASGGIIIHNLDALRPCFSFEGPFQALLCVSNNISRCFAISSNLYYKKLHYLDLLVGRTGNARDTPENVSGA